jgi:CheY-like chemotaxis protein
VDLGTGSSNGIALLTALRSQGYKGSICVHSNRFLHEDLTRAIKAGASAVIAKPMSRSQLIALLIDVTTDPRPCFAYIDDSVSFLIGMRLKMKHHCEMQEFRSSGEFFKKIDQDPSLLDRLDFVLSDYYFAPGDPHNGESLAKALRSKGYRKPILLVSSGDFLDPTPVNQSADWPFDACIPKLITEWDELNRHVQRARTKSNS